MSLARLLRTVRPLRGRQLAAQGLHRLRARVEDPGVLLERVPWDGAAPQVTWTPNARWLHPDGSPLAARDVQAGTFAFVGETHELVRTAGWDAAGASRLWRYNLHYHGFLFGLDFSAARALVLDYLEREPPRRGAVGYEPYPLSLRCTAWIPLFFGRWRAETLADGELAARLWLELRRMLVWLEGHLETHLGANHLLENAVALALAGACFGGPDATRWRRRGIALLRNELDEQLLPDGGHFERSPMYQQRVLYGLGLLLASGDEELRALCAEPAARAAGWLEAMTHPDGGVALFNDAALGVYPETAALLAWLAELGVRPTLAADRGPDWIDLRPSGYLVATSTSGDRLFLDAGEIGPAYQPGHAHADFLSIELTLGGARFVVDAGNKQYEAGPDRAFARGVAAHSTVFVEGEEPLELWGSFRVGRRGRPIAVAREHDDDGVLVFRASHDGYVHLPGRPVPTREVRWSAGALELRDVVRGATDLPAISQLVVDGAWRVVEADERRVRFERDGREALVIADGPIEVLPGRTFPRFGVETPAHRLVQRTRVAPVPDAVSWTVGRREALELVDARIAPAARALAEAGR